MDNTQQRDIGILIGKVDALLMQLTEHIKKDEEAWRRVATLERRFAWYAGAIAVLGLFTTTFLKKIGFII